MAHLDGRTVGQFSVHVLTAAGAACALLALMAAVGGQWPAMFAWLGLALVVDAADGPLARRFDLARTLPRWSGETLDLVVDFTTYVFVPAYAIVAGDTLDLQPAEVAHVFARKVERPYVVPVLEQRAHYVRADEARRAGYQGLHAPLPATRASAK